ncbi:MAG: glycerol-3-phosphate 1-O-acyltransferase [Bacteroidetes bacterium]|nr:MAG: glycerol-3-phosphate 1-O-acyltransferase [Bacteroidota bacterium]TAG87482.1 MAG: glycerol-3-phosphate 1-O-acyltransferase [Bacteroidota bacterium]
MDIFYLFCAGLLAYLIGSVPTAVWVGLNFYGKDVRDYGSGNAGATNTFRVLGKKAGIIVMLVDVLKGFVATELAFWLIRVAHLVVIDDLLLSKIIFYKLIFGCLAVLGHIFPIYVGFRGGKGVATLLGMMLAVDWKITLICVGIFIVVLLLSKYVSLGSLLATLAFPLLLLIPYFKPEDSVLIVFGFLMFIIVAITHQKNIQKLITGQENKAKIFKKKQQS